MKQLYQSDTVDAIVDDSGGGTDGTIFDQAFWQAFLGDLVARFDVAVKSTNATLAEDEGVVIADTGGIALTLPAGAAGIDGRGYYVKNVAATAVTLDTTGADTIDGESSLSLDENDAYLVVWSNTAGEWVIVSSKSAGGSFGLTMSRISLGI